MNKRSVKFLAFLIWAGLSFQPFPVLSATGSMSIAVVVNEGAITMSDVNDRLQLILSSSGLPKTEEIRSKLMPQVVGALIEEQIKMQEAKRMELTVSKAEIDEGFAMIAKQNNFTPEQFLQILKRGGINISTMERQIESQIAWSKIVQKKIRPQVIVSDNDIDTYLERLGGAIGKAEYLVSEIFIPVDNAEKDKQADEFTRRLVQEIRSGKAPFFKVAQQFSQSAGANAGGNLGWVQQGQLEPELDAVLPTIGAGKISNPVRTHTGYHILLVREQRLIARETMPSREQVMNQIGTERLERQARRYLMDIKSAAYIDDRLGS